MDVVIKIQNRDALLLWTVPYVTGHYPSMDMIIDELVRTKEITEAPFPVAFTFQHEKVNELPASQWVDVQARLERLSEQTNDNNDAWRLESIEMIRNDEPVYIWLDEFQRWFNWHVEKERPYADDRIFCLSVSPRMPQTHADCLKAFMFDSTILKRIRSQPEVAETGDDIMSVPDDWQNNPNLTKRQKQHQAILTIIRIKEFEPMKIPDGEKGTIKRLCEEDYPMLFDGDTSFDNAWKAGRDLFKMAHHASYSNQKEKSYK